MTTLIRPAQDADAGPGTTGRQLPGTPFGLWMWPALATLACTLTGIRGPLLGTDEIVTWDVAERSTARILAMLHRVDAVHGTYYLLMHGWTALFGSSHTSLRMPSALAMAATAAVVTLIGRRLFGERAGLCGGVLFAVVPVVSRYGQEARSYALVVLAATVATLLLLRAFDRPRSWGRWAAYSACLAVVGLLHLVALTVVAGHLAAVLLRARRRRRELWCFLAAAAVGGACAAPVILLGRSQASRQLFWVPEPDLWALAGIWPQVFASSLCAGAVVTLAALAGKERREALLPCAALVVVPPLVLWAASHGDVSYFRFQYVMFTVPHWAVLAGAGLAAAARSWRVVAVVLAALSLLVLPDQRRMREPFEHDVPHGADYAGAARTIEKYHRPGDGVVYVRGGPWMLDRGVRYYLGRDPELREVFLARSAAENDELYPAYCTQPARCLRGESRIWVVVPGTGPDPLESVPAVQARVLRAQYTTYGTERLSGLTVALLQRKS
ncbi:glycosyltransferase family 39 protein [Streptomyces spororaveus]|uniref:glycosyltransferase family 39 protein n=1 Tax=Streptomyces spororaveus TaxID=284039 RepID=UPI00192043BC|nr:glycosyltransferase family 39 protein [Streptomyces spororaveus]